MGKIAAGSSSALTSLRVLGRAGIITPYSPKKLVGLVQTLRGWGTGPAGGFISLAVRAPHETGLVDERGELTWSELHRRTNALARSLAEQGVAEGGSVALMCRNHRGFVETSIAVAKLGADVLYLNTAFAGPQLSEVMERESPDLLVHDEEFTELLSRVEGIDRVLAWTDDGSSGDALTLDGLIEAGDESDLTPPGRSGRVVILTSGTTGTPKGAPRKEAGIPAAVSMLSRMELKRGWRTHIAAPLFHTWGYAHYMLAMLLGSTIVLRRKFDPEDCLRTVVEQRCDSVVVIPVMMQRILQLDEETLSRYDLSRVKAVAASGSAMPGDLAVSWMDHFGDHLYNIYGSTEVSWVSIADPTDLRAAPDSAGRPPHATVVRIVDTEGEPVPDGTSGRIFVRNDLLFEGYTGGGHKEVLDGLMSTGDVGRFGDDGRLYVEGRDDDMIVSGGENVFPQEVEDCLVKHEAVVEAAAIGVDDDDFGKRLRAFVVLTSEGAVDEDALREHVKSNLARYKVPRDFVFIDELPRNATGKVLKKDLDTD